MKQKSRYDFTELRISWMEHVNNEDVLRKIRTKMTLVLRIRKTQMKFLEPIMRKEVFKNLIFLRYIEDKMYIG